MLVIKGVDFSYRSQIRLQQFSVTASAGSLISLYGHNGSGKSTLLKLVSGLFPIQRGEIIWDSSSMVGDDGYVKRSIRPLLGVLLQSFSSDEKLSLIDNLVMVAKMWGLSAESARTRALWALSSSRLKDRANEPVKNLSSGTRRRLEIYRTFMHEPSLLLLDEPTAGLDAQERNQFWSFLVSYVKERQAIALIASHDEHDLHACDQVIMMREGQIVGQGRPEQLLARLTYLRTSFTLTSQQQYHNLDELGLFDVKSNIDNQRITAKCHRHELTRLLTSPLLRDGAFASCSIDQPSLADLYQDLCQPQVHS